MHSSLLKEFKEFALRGNMFDLAVGVIIGAAFNNVVQSLVKDIFMAAVGGLADKSFKSWVLPLSSRGAGIRDAERLRELNVPYIDYGQFISVTLNFLIVAAALFMVVKVYNRARKAFEEEKVAKPEEAPADVKLLTEIRDLLAHRGS